VYQIEAFHKPSPDKEILGKQLKLMVKRLWFIITWPSAILATIFAIWLLVLQPIWLQQPWMHIKLTFVVLLIIYQLKTHQFYKQLQQDVVKKSSNFMRIWNEGATLILFAVVFLVVLKNAINWVFGLIAIIVLGTLLMLGFKLYKRIRDKNPEA
jgi:putative membrane protein